MSLLTTIDSMVCKASLRKDDTVEESWKSTWTTILTCAANSTFQMATHTSTEFSTELGKLKAEFEKRKNEAMLAERDVAHAASTEVKPTQPEDAPADSPPQDAEEPEAAAKNLEQAANIPWSGGDFQETVDEDDEDEAELLMKLFGEDQHSGVRLTTEQFKDLIATATASLHKAALGLVHGSLPDSGLRQIVKSG